MILTVTLNAAIDRTYQVENFRLDVVHRPSACWIVAGGKGINVARTVTRLGGHARATGILAGHNGRFIAQSLREEGIEGRFVWVRGESRTCIAAVDPVRRSQTEINEAGPHVSVGAVRRFVRLITAMVANEPYEFVVLSGSVPPGVPDDIYDRVQKALKPSGVRVVLDSSGEALRQGVKTQPWLIKPNRLELEQLTGVTAHTPTDCVEVASRLLSEGTKAVVVTLGADGAVCVTENSAFHVPAPQIPFLSAVGSGDALLGAMLLALSQGADWQNAVRYGVGAGAANACEYGAGFVTREAVARWSALTTVCPL